MYSAGASLVSRRIAAINLDQIREKFQGFIMGFAEIRRGLGNRRACQDGYETNRSQQEPNHRQQD
jgi:hypothetical protein